MAVFLEDKRTRMQKSIFEVRTTLARAERLHGDSVRMYCLTEEGRARSRASGGAPIPERSEFWLL